MTRETFRCSACGAVNTIRKNAPTHVEIRDPETLKTKGTYRLGNVFTHSRKVQCIDELGRVARVCHFESHIEAGSVVLTGGERLHFLKTG